VLQENVLCNVIIKEVGVNIDEFAVGYSGYAVNTLALRAAIEASARIAPHLLRGNFGMKYRRVLARLIRSYRTHPYLSHKLYQ
jgi:hypothetical protein